MAVGGSPDSGLLLGLTESTVLLVPRAFLLDDFDVLSLLCHASQHGVHLRPDKHHKPRTVEPDHQHYDRADLSIDLVVAGKVDYIEVQCCARDEY